MIGDRRFCRRDRACDFFPAQEILLVLVLEKDRSAAAVTVDGRHKPGELERIDAEDRTPLEQRQQRWRRSAHDCSLLGPQLIPAALDCLFERAALFMPLTDQLFKASRLVAWVANFLCCHPVAVRAAGFGQEAARFRFRAVSLPEQECRLASRLDDVWSGAERYVSVDFIVGTHGDADHATANLEDLTHDLEVRLVFPGSDGALEVTDLRLTGFFERRF